MPQQLSEVMAMSLDDYIESTKSIAKTQTRASKNDESKFKAERRRKHASDDEDEDVDEPTTTIGIWKVPNNVDDIQNYDMQEKAQKKQWNNAGRQNNTNHQTGSRFDLRSRICGNGPMEILPHVYSQQWRLRHPNINSARPAGMPPAVPMNAPMVSRQTQWGNKNNRRNRGNRNRGNRNWGNNRSDAVNGIGGYNNGRIQRNNAWQNGPNNNVKIVSGSFNSQDMSMSARDLSNVFQPDGKSVSSNGLQLQEPSAANSGDRLKALIGINDSDLRMASKLFDYFQNLSPKTVHKPVYDMQVHKEIREIQSKPLTYKCPGGEIVSSDGAGIDCTIVPSSSGVSLNYRFA